MIEIEDKKGVQWVSNQGSHTYHVYVPGRARKSHIIVQPGRRMSLDPSMSRVEEFMDEVWHSRSLLDGVCKFTYNIHPIKDLALVLDKLELMP